MANDRTVLVTGGAGFIGLRTRPAAARDAATGCASWTTWSAATGTRSHGWPGPATSSWSSRTCATAAPSHQAMKGCHARHPLRRGVDQQEPGRPATSRWTINMVGSHNVFAAAADHGVRRLVFASSASVYGEPDRLPMHEDEHAAPAHAVLHQQAGRRGPARVLPAAGRAVVDRAAVLQRLRPRAEDDRVLHLGDQPLRQPAADGEPPVIDGRGEQSMDFVHVHDIARAGGAGPRGRARQRRRSTSGPASTPASPSSRRILIDAVGADVEPQFNPPRRAGQPPRRRHPPGP